MPFSGTSNFLEIQNVTENWDAGYGTDACTVSITSWASNRIQLVANVNQSGLCSMAIGDQLIIKVWNPQSVTNQPAVFIATVSGS